MNVRHCNTQRHSILYCENVNVAMIQSLLLFPLFAIKPWLHCADQLHALKGDYTALIALCRSITCFEEWLHCHLLLIWIATEAQRGAFGMIWSFVIHYMCTSYRHTINGNRQISVYWNFQQEKNDEGTRVASKMVRFSFSWYEAGCHLFSCKRWIQSLMDAIQLPPLCWTLPMCLDPPSLHLTPLELNPLGRPG